MAKKRRKNDFYPTPGGATVALFEDVDSVAIRGNILEPCVGAGDMAQIIKDYRGNIRTNDIDTRWRADSHEDATQDIFAPNVDWIITNPPFNVGFEILENLYIQARYGIAMFLRVTFMEPTKKRGNWLANHPPSKIIHVPRISFTGDRNNDSVHCAWLIWYKGYTPKVPYVTVTRDKMAEYTEHATRLEHGAIRRQAEEKICYG